MVCILVQHSTLFTIGHRMVFGMALFFSYILTKKVIGGPTFHSFMVSFVLSSILRSNPLSSNDRLLFLELT